MSVKDSDGHKLLYHPESVAEWKKTGFSYPLHIEAGITNRCNHSCIQCTLDWINHAKDDIDKEVFLSTIESAEDIGVKSIYFAGEGESTLHPNLPEFLEKAFSCGIKTSVSSNGGLLDKNLSRRIMPFLSWIRFSVDAGTPKTYSEIHRVKESEFDTVLSNISDFVEVKKEMGSKIDVGVQTLLMPENVTEIEYLAKISKDIGVDNYQVKPAHVHPKSSYKGGIYKYAHDEIKKRLSSLDTPFFKTIMRTQSMERLTTKRTYKRCHAFDFYCLLDAKGNVTPCNIWYGKEDFIFGNVYNDSLQNIWEGKKRKDVISKITNLEHSCCKEYRCRQDVMNRYLERVLNPEINDEFI